MLTENTETLERLVTVAISDELLYTLCSRVVNRLTVSIPVYVNGFASIGELYKMSGICLDFKGRPKNIYFQLFAFHSKMVNRQ